MNLACASIFFCFASLVGHFCVPVLPIFVSHLCLGLPIFVSQFCLGLPIFVSHFCLGLPIFVSHFCPGPTFAYFCVPLLPWVSQLGLGFPIECAIDRSGSGRLKRSLVGIGMSFIRRARRIKIDYVVAPMQKHGGAPKACPNFPSL